MNIKEATTLRLGQSINLVSEELTNPKSIEQGKENVKARYLALRANNNTVNAIRLGEAIQGLKSVAEWREELEYWNSLIGEFPMQK